MYIPEFWAGALFGFMVGVITMITIAFSISDKEDY